MSWYSSSSSSLSSFNVISMALGSSKLFSFVMLFLCFLNERISKTVRLSPLLFLRRAAVPLTGCSSSTSWCYHLICITVYLSHLPSPVSSRIIFINLFYCHWNIVLASDSPFFNPSLSRTSVFDWIISIIYDLFFCISTFPEPQLYFLTACSLKI